MSQKPSSGRLMFVPYAPLRRAAILSYALAACALALAMGLMAYFAAPLGSPAAASVQPESSASFRGLFREAPYPHLLVQDDSGAVSVVLLVGGGKGGIGRSEVREGPCQVEGRLLQRGATRLLSDAALSALPEPLRFEPPAWSVGGQPAEFAGEIIDPKCAFGRMLPGRGAAHRACAQMCIQGGVPPLLLLEGSSERHLLILDHEGRPAVQQLLPFVGEPVRLKGVQATYAGLEVLFLAASSAISRR